MRNPHTSYDERSIIIDLVLSEPWRFTPLPDNTGNPMRDEWARKKNGGAVRGFVRDFRQRYLT
ncbi:MAG: hypothetical protein Q4Q58_07270 [Thermoplasmata archaeon]|nr:hypothetical protein [Thermoplasmata archaeon]